MTLTTLALRAEKLVTDNSPLILTALGVTGTIATAVLTGRATLKAAHIIADAEYKEHLHGAHGSQLERREKIELVWKLYIPAATVCTLTVACIITANRIDSRRAAALATAYKISEKAAERYEEKVKEKFGEAKATSVRDDIAQDEANENPPSEQEIFSTGKGSHLCYEPFTGRYFYSDMENLKRAQNSLNYQINNNWYASLSDFYDLIGLERTELSDDFGWNADKLLELSFTTVLADGRPCLSMHFVVQPIRHYARVQ